MMNGIEGNTPMLNQGASVVCFYHEYEENGCFSNWYPASFEYAGQHYNCVEQYMMYQKVLMFRQYDLAEKILASNNPSEIKRLGRTRFPEFNSDVWDRTSYAKTPFAPKE